MNREQATNSSWQHKIKELAKCVHIGVSIPKEKEANKSMYIPAIVLAASTKMDKIIEELTKLFGQLNMNIRALA